MATNFFFKFLNSAITFIVYIKSLFVRSDSQLQKMEIKKNSERFNMSDQKKFNFVKKVKKYHFSFWLTKRIQIKLFIIASKFAKNWSQFQILDQMFN